MDSKSRTWLRLQSVLLALGVLLLLALLAWLSLRYQWTTEWSDGRHHAVSADTVELLQALDAPLEAVAFVPPDDVLHGHVEQLLQRYQRYAPEFRYRIINPDARPDLVRELGIESHGEILLEYRGRQERVAVPSEPRVSAAIQRLQRGPGRPLLYLTGHGERSLEGEANHDLGAFGTYLSERGHQLQPLRPAASPGIPLDAEMLVIAGPRADWLPGVRQMIRNYLDAGGNLLWLVDHGDRERMAFLVEYLGLEVLPGTVVEPQAEQLLGVNDPRLLVTDDYADHPGLQRVQGISLFVGAQALEIPKPDAGWSLQPLIMSEIRHWNETGDVDQPRFDAAAGERRGPLLLGVSMSRPLEREGAGDGEQRVVVVGNADFLSNAYLGNGANLQLGVGLVDWVAAAERPGLVAGRASLDQRLDMSQALLLLMGFGFLLVLPGLYVAVAGWLWWRRKRA
ncbi:MAG: Gldg family protein [Ectothiorhodospiraceae bacterium]|nr:Gldg family protein [Ectothiorhodospiraceae bacterium]MCH8505754.1 GldG family protein [Ectothiorhodospiraceae bacterium]